MNFNIDDYKDSYVMHCKTKEEAEDFCNYMHSIGRRWANGESYLNRTYWNQHNDTVYNFNNDTYGRTIYYNKQHNYTILEWGDFMEKKEFTKSDLKTGDVVMRRNGKVGIINREHDVIIVQNGYGDLDYIKSDLTSFEKQWDIIAVRRPLVKSDCQFDAFQCQWGTLVYERKEVEEMTLEEVCKALGKEIKIVKSK